MGALKDIKPEPVAVGRDRHTTMEPLRDRNRDPKPSMRAREMLERTTNVNQKGVPLCSPTD